MLKKMAWLKLFRIERVKYVAKCVRTISVPPVMVTAFVVTLAYNKPYYFHDWIEMGLAILFLGIIPVLAYPVSKIKPKLKENGREAERNMAFVFSLLGYTGAFTWSMIISTSNEIKIICSTYFISVILLTICNKLLHFRASGHACSFTGPLIMLIYFIGCKTIIPCFFIAGVIVWSSLCLKRHTKKELLGGMIVCFISFVLAWLFVSV